MDLDFGQDSEELKKLEVSKSTSKLDKAIQKLITILFDIESMKKAMVEFEVRNWPLRLTDILSHCIGNF